MTSQGTNLETGCSPAFTPVSGSGTHMAPHSCQGTVEQESPALGLGEHMTTWWNQGRELVQQG